MLILLKNVKAGCWVFALYNNLAVREEVLSALKRTIRPMPVFEWTYTPEAPAPISYLQNLTTQQQSDRATVCFFDLERGGEAGWKALDYYRETLADHPHVIVIWITQAGRIAAARKAPHFWAQRSMVFDFTIAVHEQPLELMGAWAGQALDIQNYDDAVRQLRIYQGLLDDYLGLPDAPPQTVADLHGKVASLLNYLDRREEALPYLQELLTLADSLKDKNLKAEALTNLAQLERIRSGNPTAILLLEEARLLATTPFMRATIAYNLGSALTYQELEKGKKLLIEASQLFRQVGDKLGQANVLKAIGDVQYFRKEIEEALASYAEASQLFRQVGAKLGQANVYLALGRLKNDRSEFEKAISLYEQIGDGYSIARGKYYYALSLIDSDEVTKAKDLLIEAKNIWIQIEFESGISLVDEQLRKLS